MRARVCVLGFASVRVLVCVCVRRSTPLPGPQSVQSEEPEVRQHYLEQRAGGGKAGDMLLILITFFTFYFETGARIMTLICVMINV